MVGDELIASPHFSNDRSIVMQATPEQIWPWFAQMGFGRAGWYSWDLVDNLGRRSATELHPEWMVTEAGEPMPAGPMSFETPVVDAPHRLVIAVLAKRIAAWRIDFTLSYELEPQRTSTLVKTRARARIDGPLGAAFAKWLLGPGDGVMVRKQLKGVQQRAERLAATEAAAVVADQARIA